MVKEDKAVADVPFVEEKEAPDVPIVADEKATPEVPIVADEKAAPIVADEKAAPDGSIVAEEEVPCVVCLQLPGTIINFSNWINKVAMHKCAGCGEMRDYFQRSSDGSSTSSYYAGSDEEEDQGSDLDKYR